MNITEKEVESVSKLDAFNRYQYLIKKIASFEKLYSLKSPEGNWAISEVDGNYLFPTWSAPAFAKNCKIDGWSDFDIEEIALDTFQEDIISFLKQENYLLNVFPVGKTTGFVVDTEEFLRDLKLELTKYE